ncbi:hypothetical protein MHSWG343_10000 [Candidatus Mycoplasma haematohominis]|uniref:Uncharacterized protein n=1 Tax=Candidatus Mycoplasma haematohominis TaxID=1494318 RepID=A0A478FRE3_9MOLU|nr:hypothetical protein MHSWG343_10000 [Candidatus Mycoplasma haemohominis]
MSLGKAAAAGGVAILVASGGYGLSFLVNNGMPGYEPFKTNTSNLYVYEYPDYFVDASKNESWWNWVYKNRYSVGSDNKDSDNETRENPQQGFTGLDKGAGKDAKAIQKVCGDVYKLEKTKVKTENLSTGDFSESDIWRYCTAVKKKPKTIDRETEEKATYTTENSYGKDNTDKLVAITGNDSFWNEQQRLFFEDKWERSGSKATENSLFHNLFNKNKRGERKDAETLRSTCQIAYGKTSSGSEAPEADVFRYCSLKRTKS